MDALCSDLTKGLEQQESSIRELTEDIAKLHMQITGNCQEKKIKVQMPNWSKPFGGRDNQDGDHPPLVRSKTPVRRVYGPDDYPPLVRSKPYGGRDDQDETEASTIREKAYMARTILQDTSSNRDESELNSRSSLESDVNENTAQGTSSDLNSSEISSRASIESDANENISTISETRYEIDNEIESPKDTPSYKEGIEQWPRAQASEAGGNGRFQGRRDYRNQGGKIPTQKRMNVFEVPKFPEDVRKKADRMIDEALDKVPSAAHRDANSKRTVLQLHSLQATWISRQGTSTYWNRFENISTVT